MIKTNLIVLALGLVLGTSLIIGHSLDKPYLTGAVGCVLVSVFIVKLIGTWLAIHGLVAVMASSIPVALLVNTDYAFWSSNISFVAIGFLLSCYLVFDNFKWMVERLRHRK